MSSLTFRFDPPERPKKKKFDKRLVFDLLTNYLQPTAKERPHDVAEEIIHHMRKAGDAEHDKLAELLVQIATQIPYNHVSQLKLVRIAEILGSPKENFGWIFGGTKFVKRTRRLSKLRALVQDEIPFDTFKHAEYFINFHSFCALLSAGSLWDTNPSFAIRCLRAAFEDRARHDDGGSVQGARRRPYGFVMAAAQWIFWYGQALYKQVTWSDFGNDPITASMWQCGPGYKASGLARGVLDKSRWEFWRTGFQTAARESTYPEECRILASKAACIMEQLERDTVFSR